VHASFRDATRAVRLVAAALAPADFNRDAMAGRAAQHWITVTELADTLTRDDDVPFKRSHEIAARFVAAREASPGLAPSRALEEASIAVIGRALEYSDRQIEDMLSPIRFVEVRRTLGGPAPVVTEKALSVSREALDIDRAWVADRTRALEAAARALREQAALL
jgi:argininosuccinate lyase